MNDDQPHLNVFNPRHPQDDTMFPQFRLLPAELRQEIWHWAMSRRRIITFSVDVLHKEGRQENYHIIVRGYRVFSKYLRVCQEARFVALRFYRVHHPCLFAGADTEWKVRRRPSTGRDFAYFLNQKLKDQLAEGTVYINPEYDIVNIRTIWRPLPWNRNKGIWGDSCVLHLLRRLRTLDPRNIGVSNLAINNDSLENIDRYFPWKLLRPLRFNEVRYACKAILENIQQVYFVSLHGKGRSRPGSRKRPARPEAGGQGEGGEEGSRQVSRQHWDRNRSVPVFSSSCTFDYLPGDPRAIKPDLERVYMEEQDRMMIFRWQTIISQLGIEHRDGQVDYRFLVAHEVFAPRSGKGIGGLWEEGKRWVEAEDRLWVAKQGAKPETIKHVYGRYPLETPEELQNQPETVFGFWMFPVEAEKVFPSGPGVKTALEWRKPAPAWRPFSEELREEEDNVSGVAAAHWDVSQYPPALAVAQLG